MKKHKRGHNVPIGFNEQKRDANVNFLLKSRKTPLLTGVENQLGFLCRVHSDASCKRGLQGYPNAPAKGVDG